MKQISFWSLILMVVFIINPVHAAPSVDEILEQHFEAIGGLDAHKQVQTRVVTSELNIPAQGAQLETKIIAQAPNKFHRVEQITVSGQKVTVSERGFDGTTLWNKPRGQAAAVVTDEALVRKGKFAAQFYSNVEILTDANLTYLKTETIDGKGYYVLVGAYPSDSVYESGTKFYIGADDSLLLKAVGFDSDADESLTYKYSDYREVNGKLYPHVTEVFRGESNQPVATTRIISFELDASVEDAVFSVPE